jgi:hypothetical protein
MAMQLPTQLSTATPQCTKRGSSEYWEVVDHLLLKDPEIHAQVYGKQAPG